ncbi:MAG: hypothetical protein RLZZ453_980 [Chlamydiota bacterium]|jgi:hypothetical protein
MKWKSTILFTLTLGLATLQAEIVEIVSNMYTEEILADACFEKIRNTYEIRITDQKYHLPITSDYASIKRYIIFNGHDNLAHLDNCSPGKKVLFMMEPERISYVDAEPFSRIYTWDDEAIDNKKFFKFFFPDLMPMIDELPAFEEKKLCTMVVRNWHAKHRGPIVEFFSKKPKGEFEFYGSPYPNLIYNRCYKGRIPGLNCGKEKIDTLKNYRFCICFENRTHLNGYISEKIFPCFAAGCVPVYWGAPNIEEYIPKDCFIDYRDFQNVEELYVFLKTMPESVYEQYLDSIRQFLSSEQAQLFSPQYFSQTLYEAATQ